MRTFDPRLLRAVPVARGAVSGVAVVTLVQGVAVVVLAFATAEVVVAVVRGRALQGPLTFLMGVVAARAVLAALLEVLAGRAGVRVSTALRSRLVADSLARPAGMPAGPVPLTLVTTGVTAVEPYVARFLPALVAAGVVPALAVGTLLVVDPWSALVVVLTLPLLPVFAALIGRTTAVATQRRWAAMAGLAGHFLDVMRGLPTLAAYGRAGRQSQTVGEVSQRHRLATMRTLRLAFLSTTALELLSTICVAIVAVLVGIRLANGSMGLSTGLVAILLAPEAYWPVRRMGAEFHVAADGSAALTQALDRLDRAVPDPRPVAGAVVDMAGLGFGYEPGRPVLAGVSATLSTGLTVVTGPSGAGKSTLLGLLAGLLTPTTGRLTAPLAHLVTQSPFLAPASVADNLRLGTSAQPPAMWAALREVGLDGFVAGLPRGIETVLGDDGVGLSAGQRARLGLARALLSSAPVVLLDEPTAHLDEDSAAIAHRAIRRIARERVVVAVTHRQGLLAMADAHLAVPVLTGRGPHGSLDAHAGAAPARPADQMALQQTDATPIRQRGEPDGRPTRGRAGPKRPAWIRDGAVWAAVLGGAASTAGVALTATSGWLIVSASARPQILTLLTAIVAVRAFGMARPALRYAERLRSHDAALRKLADRRVRLYRALIPLTPARLGRRSRGERLTAAVADLDDQVDGLVRGTVPLAGLTLSAVAATVAVATILPHAGLVLAAVVAVCALSGWRGYAAERRGHRRELAARADIGRLTLLVTAEAAAVQAAAAGPTVRAWLSAAQERLTAATRLRASARAGTAGVVLLVAGVGSAATAVLAASSSLGGPVAALVVLTPLAVGDLLLGLADGVGAWARADEASARLRSMTDQAPAVTDGGNLLDRTAQSQPRAPTGPPGLTVHEAVAEWEPGRRVGPLSLDVAPGEHVVLLGPNGCGKSTLLALVARHLDPVAGRVVAGGTCLVDLGLAAWRAQVAFVDDEPHLFAGTLRANLALAAPQASDIEIRVALELAGLADWAGRLPEGLETPLGAGGRGVSGGERSRLALARALLSQRAVVLLDEPVAHLDHPTAMGVLADLARATRGRTVVMTTHRPDGLELFDRVVRLDAGAGVPAAR